MPSSVFGCLRRRRPLPQEEKPPRPKVPLHHSSAHATTGGAPRADAPDSRRREFDEMTDFDEILAHHRTAGVLAKAEANKRRGSAPASDDFGLSDALGLSGEPYHDAQLQVRMAPLPKVFDSYQRFLVARDALGPKVGGGAVDRARVVLYSTRVCVCGKDILLGGVGPND